MSRFHFRRSQRDITSRHGVVITRGMERDLLNGSVDLQVLDSEECQALTNTLQVLIDTAEVNSTSDNDVLHGCNNTVITYSQQIVQQLSERRYKERLAGISVANSVQYIRFKPGSLRELPEELLSSIVSVLVSLIVEHIASSRNEDQDYLLKWAGVVIRRIGKLLQVNEILLDALLKPITQYSMLRALSVDMNTLVNRQMHLDIILEQLSLLQPDLDEEFKRNVEEARDYLNSTDVGNVIRRPSMGIFNSISRKINRVLTRAMEPTESSGHRDSESAERTSSIDGVVETCESEVEEVAEDPDFEDADAKSDINLNDELLLDTVPARAVLLRNLVTGYIMSGHNDSRVQLLFQEFSSALGMSKHTVLALETYIAAELVSAIHSSNTGTTKKVTRNLKIAAVAAGGGALIALSAGVASPAVAAGIAVLGIGGGGMSGYLSTTEEAELLASIFGVGSSGLVGWRGKKASSRVDPDFHHINEQSGRSLTVCIGICGTLSSGIEFISMWEEAVRAPLCDFYAMEWETGLLRCLGRMSQLMSEQPFSDSAARLQEKLAPNNALVPVIQWPLPLIHFAQPFENAFTIVNQKSIFYGATLAQAIMDRHAVGERPISLLGYSVGARVIFHALLKLYDKQKLSIIKDVVLMGLPVIVDTSEWFQCSSVVAGRLINVYSRHDWQLGYIYRDIEFGQSVAGLRPVTSERVENYDATDFIKGHHSYMSKISDILTLVHIDL
ncbi:uncharacterized protein BBOV_IV002030 [Babesia bovis T2Bo]|uniref:DUF726 domain-containing protein n=1 Tax=Babesia bovis TaxID=5865 RepID=A7AVH4_BABBO|nr:uncharacterized protein BBOV_IV002030 [Babesia bovis T2Bo]EDO05800.1 hypothetical protein BBOV_IV002030 [Babesia bovis T2Bo]|eukprot:XP_001609368.1 hypothetical protein [Babesia bovis T2Bo]